MGYELQNDDYLLPGNLGIITVFGKTKLITKSFKDKLGTTTLTISPLPIPKNIEVIDNKKCVFSVELIDNRLKELGALEDIPHEEIKK